MSISHLATGWIGVVAHDKNGDALSKHSKNSNFYWEIYEAMCVDLLEVPETVLVIEQDVVDSLSNYLRIKLRQCIVVTTDILKPHNHNCNRSDDVFEALFKASQMKKTPVVAGEKLISQLLSKYMYQRTCTKIMELKAEDANQSTHCIPGVDQNFLKSFLVDSEEKLGCGSIFTLKLAPGENPEEMKYLGAIRQILEHGETRRDRTGTGTLSMFAVTMRFDISQSIPVLTCKKILWKKVISELLWMISGSTFVGDLQKRGVNFWNQNSSRDFLDKRGLAHYEEGDLGPVYGFQWRHFGAEYHGHDSNYIGEGKDQLAEVIHSLKTDPYSRRIVMSAWNPAVTHQMALPPCHMMVQFYVTNEGRLNCHLQQRSGDMFLGVPFNIFSYCVLTYMIAHLTGYTPGEFVHTIGDAHIYLNHVAATELMLARTPRAPPKLVIKRSVSSIDDFKLEDFDLENYSPHDFIPVEMAV